MAHLIFVKSNRPEASSPSQRLRRDRLSGTLFGVPAVEGSLRGWMDGGWEEEGGFMYDNGLVRWLAGRQTGDDKIVSGVDGTYEDWARPASWMG